MLHRCNLKLFDKKSITLWLSTNFSYFIPYFIRRRMKSELMNTVDSLRCTHGSRCANSRTWTWTDSVRTVDRCTAMRLIMMRHYKDTSALQVVCTVSEKSECNGRRIRRPRDDRDAAAAGRMKRIMFRRNWNVSTINLLPPTTKSWPQSGPHFPSAINATVLHGIIAVAVTTN